MDALFNGILAVTIFGGAQFLVTLAVFTVIDVYGRITNH